MEEVDEMSKIDVSKSEKIDLRNSQNGIVISSDVKLERAVQTAEKIRLEFEK